MTIEILSENAVKLLKEKGLRVAFAESCTGGMVSAAITSVAGSSQVLDLSIVTYSNGAKVKYVEVSERVLAKYGAVSSQTALQMAAGIKAAANADIGVGITGIAGPDGGSDEKPVGTVYVAVNDRVEHFEFTGNRKEIREETTKQTLTMLGEHIYDGFSI